MDRARLFAHTAREKKQAISPIIATLLLILIAIAAGVVVYAYVIGFVGNASQNTGPVAESLKVNAASYSSGNHTLMIFVQNTGHNSINITQAYVYSGSNSLVSDNLNLGTVIAPGSTVTVYATGISGLSVGQYYSIQVVTKNGNEASLNWQN